MKRKYNRVNYPFRVLLILSMIISVMLYIKNKIPLLIFLMIFLFFIIIVSYGKEIHISVKNKEIRIYKLMLFVKIFVHIIIPFRIIILTQKVYRNRISGKFGFAGSTTESSYRLLIFERDREKPSFETTGMKDYIEELGSFISNSLNIEIERKALRNNRNWKYDLTELNNEKN